MARLNFRRRFLAVAALAAVGALSACGPGQGSSSTTVVLTGPADKVEALVARHKSFAPPTPSQREKLDDGRERASFYLSKGLPLGEIVDLGKEAAKDGVSFEFSSGTKWGSGDPAPQGASPQGASPQGDPAASPPARSKGPVV